METILRIENLTHTYAVGTPFARDAIDGITCDIHASEFIGIIGHTGSGKSTLIQHLNGLLKPTKGTIALHGQDIWEKPKEMAKVRFQVGLVFQYPEYQLFEETVYKDIAFGPMNMKLDGKEVERRVYETMELVGLDRDLAKESPFTLSGGQKRRVAIAGVMAMEPEILVLDEPTAGLDPQGRERLLSQIRLFKEEKKKTILLVSHSMEDISNYSERILVLSKGKLILDGTPDEVFSHGKELRESGLDVPKAAQIAEALRQRGVDVPQDIYTVDALASYLLAKGGAK